MSKQFLRREQIIAYVKDTGFVTIDALSEVFNVTPQTIRRDINELSEEGTLQRFHGGAAAINSTENVTYASRLSTGFDVKQNIAKEAIKHIPDHASLFINIGTTTEAVAASLGHHVGLRIITNNLHIAQISAQNQKSEVIIAGGSVRNRDMGIVGQATVDFINQFKADFGIIGISGIDEEGSLLDFDYSEVRVAQAIIKNSHRVILVCDQSKFGRRAMVRLGGLSDIDLIISDHIPNQPWKNLLHEHDVKFIEVD